MGIVIFPGFATSTRYCRNHVTSFVIDWRPIASSVIIWRTLGFAPIGVTVAPAIATFGSSGTGLSLKPATPSARVNGYPLHEQRSGVSDRDRAP